MIVALATILAPLLSLASLVSLALAMERHQRDLLGRLLPDRSRRRLAIAGWSLVVLAYAAAALAWGPAVGAMLWIGLCSLSAAIVLLAVSWRAHRW